MPSHTDEAHGQGAFGCTVCAGTRRAATRRAATRPSSYAPATWPTNGAPASCAEHQPYDEAMSYGTRIGLDERRHNAGERQRQCAECGLWIWPSEMKSNRKD